MACPVCRAAFRATVECSRCGADLRPLMELAARAWRLRQAARTALAAGEFTLAGRLAAQAQALQATAAGRSLQVAAGAVGWSSKPGFSAA